MMFSQITVAPVLSSFVRTGPFSANISFYTPEIPASLEVSLFVANNSTTLDEVWKFVYILWLCSGHYLKSQQHSRASLWQSSKPLKARWSCRTSILVRYIGLLWQLLTVVFVLWVNHALLSSMNQLLSTLPFALETSSFVATGSMWTRWVKLPARRMSWIPYLPHSV